MLMTSFNVLFLGNRCRLLTSLTALRNRKIGSLRVVNWTLNDLVKVCRPVPYLIVRTSSNGPVVEFETRSQIRRFVNVMEHILTVFKHRFVFNLTVWLDYLYTVISQPTTDLFMWMNHEGNCIRLVNDMMFSMF